MLVYVDLEHPSLSQEAPDRWEESLARRLKVKYRFEDLTHDQCLIVRYHQISPEVLRRLNAQAVIISGCSSEFERYSDESLAGMRAIYQAAAWPTLGLCGGMQLMAQAYGAPIGAMGPLETAATSGSAQPFPEVGYQPGLKEEHGFKPVNVLERQPLFEGLGSQAMIYESHYWEAQSVTLHGSKVRLKGRTLVSSPDGFRVQTEISVDDRPFANFGTVSWQRADTKRQ